MCCAPGLSLPTTATQRDRNHQRLPKTEALQQTAREWENKQQFVPRCAQKYVGAE